MFQTRLLYAGENRLTTTRLAVLDLPEGNAMRAPGHWNTYDIVFHRPRFNSDGSVAQPGRVTVIHNGVLVQDNVALWGQTVHMAIGTYKAHADRLPLMLQDHGHPVRYRNIWLRELPD